MGFYESLDQLVGTGLAACAAGLGIRLPAAAMRDGAGLSALIRARGEAEPYGAVLDALARDIWLSQETRGLSLSMAEAHAVALVDVLAERPLAAATMMAAVHGRGQGTPTAGEIAAEILGRAALPAELVPEHAGFLLERLFTLILADPQLLAAPVLATFAEQHGAGPAASAVVPHEAPLATVGPAGTDIAIAAPLDGRAVAAPVRARLAELVAQSGISPALRPGRVEELVSLLAEARRRLLGTDSPDVAVRALNARAAEALAAGDVGAASALLAEAREAIRAARRAAEARLRSEILQLQRRQVEQAEATARLADLAAARQDFGRAAQLYAEAAAELPLSERAMALDWQLEEARALRLSAEQGGDDEPLRRAAALYAEVMRRAMSAGDRRATALADLGLGQVLLRQAEAGPSGERLETAAEAFQRAVSALDRQSEPATAAQALVGLGNALALIAERDPAATGRLVDAARAYQDAADLTDPALTPIRFGLTQLKLGAALVRLGERDGAASHWIAAAGAMLAALEALEPVGAHEQAELARSSLRRLHERLPQLLAAPST